MLVPNSAADINDLRTALAFLASIPGQLVTTREPVDPAGELAAVYKLVGAGTPLPPPTRTGPAMLFENVKGFGIPVVVGVLASRLRTALLMNSTIERLPFDLLDALNHPAVPVGVPAYAAPCQQVVIRPPFDLRTLIPAPTHTPLDAGPYFNMGLLRAEASACRGRTASASTSSPAATSTSSAPRPSGRAAPCPSRSTWAWTPPSTWPPVSSRPRRLSGSTN
jgi:3-polyprenyl-4-hydroxybenzoate decarboxylase